jgi:hypothetical protein
VTSKLLIEKGKQASMDSCLAAMAAAANHVTPCGDELVNVGLKRKREHVDSDDLDGCAPTSCSRGLISPTLLPPAANGMSASAAPLILHAAGMIQQSHFDAPACGGPVSAQPDANAVKGLWTREEDAQLIDCVQKHGATRWSLVASHLVARTGKQCRER